MISVELYPYRTLAISVALAGAPCTSPIATPNSSRSTPLASVFAALPRWNRKLPRCVERTSVEALKPAMSSSPG